jgi:ACS family allantoate permease-like MFS transporter
VLSYFGTAIIPRTAVSQLGNMTAEKDPQDTITHNANSDPEEIGESKVISIKGADPALQLTHGERIVYTPEEEASVLSKIDWHLLPLMCWVYALQFADKISLNYASLMGIRTDTNLDANSQQYSWVSSIFYAGYILWEYVLLLYIGYLGIEC